MMLRDPLAMSPSVWPALSAVAWIADGTNHAAPSDTIVAASGYAWLITIMATSACNVGASVYGATPTTEGTTSVSASSVRSDVGGRITSVVVCSVTPEGAPSAPVST